MKFIILIVFITASSTFANTNVNISFTQQHSFAGTKLNDENQLKSSDCLDQINNDDQDKRFARIQIENKNIPNVESDVKKNSESTLDYHSEEQNDGRLRYVESHTPNQQRDFYNSNSEGREKRVQLRSMNPQEKQNMEFERYIQHYHSAPTVETVYESAKPKMQHTLGTSSVQESSKRVIKFERQVALPKNEENIQNPSDAVQSVVNNQPSTLSSSVLMSSSSSSSPSLSPSVPSVSSASPTPAGRDGFQFDLNYNKPNYNDPSFKYNHGHQFTPSVEEPQNGYGDYYGNVYNRHQTEDNYRPVEQRPVVTKTIQIAQPAIKAKKYEVRHPAIQKEFYDIEERVVIKPAGTVVVELERPSAKILKEETTLPLGHPHPAVAAAYTPNRNTQSFSNIIYSNAGPSSTSSNQYSSLIPSPTYHQPTKEVVAESKQNRQFNGGNQFSAAATSDSSRSQNREIVVVTDGHGNQRQISTDHHVYSRDDTNKVPLRPAHNHRIVQSNISPQRSEFQGNSDNREGFSFDAEYINNSGNINLRKESKPARLQEVPSRLTESIQPQPQPQPIIKHEHKIVLSPSQHNIYLNRNQDIPQTKFIEETAQVREIKPNSQNHRGPVIVYASAKKMPETEIVQYRKSPQIIQSNVSKNRVQFSAPYAQMRYNSIDERNRQEKDQPETQRHSNVVNQRKFEKLVVEDKPEMKSTVMKNTMENKSPQAHIEVKIPDQVSLDMNKAIVVSSTIRPMFMDDDREQTHNAKLEISVTNNGEPKQKPLNDKEDIYDQSDKNNDYKNISDNMSKNDKIEIKPDCDQPTASAKSENYEIAPEYNRHGQQKFMRIVEESSEVSASNDKDMSLDSETSGVQRNLQNQNVDVNVKSTVGHVHPSGSRVIAATPAPKESTPSESFHKRRIVVNHPFQTVREVVEHEPYTNYHEIQVNEPATPAIYHSANYYQPPRDSRSSENGHSYYH
ncbi:uncharacterized protein ACRADG_002396 [Cochliomyia hominivorax]